MRGRKPSPFRVVTKTGHRPIPTPPTVEESLPARPPDLAGGAAVMWDEIARLLGHVGAISAPDQFALRLLCETYQEYEAARAVYEKAPYWKGSKAQPVISKAWHVMHAARSTILKTLPEFGLTPTSRLRLSAAKKLANQKGTQGHWLDMLAG